MNKHNSRGNLYVAAAFLIAALALLLVAGGDPTAAPDAFAVYASAGVAAGLTVVAGLVMLWLGRRR